MGTWTPVVPMIDDVDLKWFQSRGIRVSRKPQKFQSNPHYRSAAIREHATVRFLHWCYQNDIKNIWDCFGADRTRGLARRIEEAAGKAAGELFVVQVTGHEVTPADMLRRQDGADQIGWNDKPAFPPGPVVMLLTNVYQFPDAPLDHLRLSGLLTRHELTAIVWLGHELTEAWGTISGEGAYYTEVEEVAGAGRQGRVVVHYRPDSESAPYSTHEVPDWLYDDGAAIGIAWTTLFHLGAGSHDRGMVAKLIRASNVVEPPSPNILHRRSWKRSTLLDPTGWDLRGWWTWFVNAATPTTWRRYMASVPGVRCTTAVIDTVAVRAIRGRMTGRNTNQLAIRTAANAHLEALKGDQEVVLFERSWPGWLEQQKIVSIHAIMASAVEDELDGLLQLQHQLGPSILERNQALSSFGSAATETGWSIVAVMASVLTVVLGVAVWRKRASITLAPLNILGGTIALGVHTGINLYVTRHQPWGPYHKEEILVGAALEECVRFMIMKNKWWNDRPYLVGLAFTLADIASDFLQGRPVPLLGIANVARFIFHSFFSYLHQDGSLDLKEDKATPKQWDAFKRRVANEPGTAMHDDAIVDEPLVLDGEENTIPTTQLSVPRVPDRGVILPDQAGADEDGLRVMLSHGLTQDLTSDPILMERVEPKNKVHWFQPMGVAFQQPGRTDANLLAVAIYRVARSPLFGLQQQALQYEAWKAPNVRYAVDQLIFTIDKHYFDDIQRTDAAVWAWMQSYPAYQRERLIAARDRLKNEPLLANEVPGTKIMVKTDELLLKTESQTVEADELTDAFIPRPIYNVPPTVQFSSGFELNEALNRAKSVFNPQPWTRDRDFLCWSQKQRTVPAYLVFGAISDTELSALFTWAENDASHVLIVVAGDDQLVHISHDDFEIVLESDVKLCDQSTTEGPLRVEYAIERALGVSEEILDLLLAVAHSKLCFYGENFELILSRAMWPTRDTGGSNTSLGNTLVIGTAAVVAIQDKPIEQITATSYDAVFASLGYALKTKVRSSLEGSTFLKMMIYRAHVQEREILVVSPVEGRLIKMAKSYHDPRSYFAGHPTYVQAAEAFLRTVAESYNAYVLTPTFRARVDRWMRFKPLTLRPTANPQSWAPRTPAGREMTLHTGRVILTTDVQIDLESWDAVCSERYGEAHNYAWQAIEMLGSEHYARFLQHPLFLAWAAVDYG